MKKQTKFLFILILLVALIMPITLAAYTPDKNGKKVTPGEVIYFDNSNANWSNVTIYIYGNGRSYPAYWENEISMEHVEGNIYSFTVPDHVDAKEADNVIFRDGHGNGLNQTIDLSYIEDGYAYKVTGDNGTNSTGHWYLYDKAEETNRLNEAKKYQTDKEYYTVESYGELDTKIQEADIMLAGEMELKLDDTTGNYYIDFDYKMDEINTIINNLKISSKVLEDKIKDVNDNWDEYEQKYTPSSLKVLKEKVDNGNTIVNDTSKTIPQIKEAVLQIEEAISGLVNQADKTELNKLIEEVKNMDLSIYTEETVTKLEETLNQSELVSKDLEVTQESVDNQVTALKESIDGLKKKPVVQEENKNTPVEENTETKEEVKVESTAPETGDIIGVFAIVLVLAVLGLIIVTKFKNKESK